MKIICLAMPFMAGHSRYCTGRQRSKVLQNHKAPLPPLPAMQLTKVYVAPGKYDEFYSFVSGGFNGQMSVYGFPSGRLLRIIPVFSAQPGKRLWVQ